MVILPSLLFLVISIVYVLFNLNVPTINLLKQINSTNKKPEKVAKEILEIITGKNKEKNKEKGRKHIDWSKKMFKEKNITEVKVEYADFDPPHGGKGSLFTLSRGMFQSVLINDDFITGRVICTEGRYNFIEAIKEFEKRCLESLADYGFDIDIKNKALPFKE